MNIYILMFFMSKTFDPNIPIDFRMNWMWTNMIQSFRQYIEISFWHQSESYAISLQRFKFARFYCLCLLLKGSKQIRLEPIKECLTIGDTGKKSNDFLVIFYENTYRGLRNESMQRPGSLCTFFEMRKSSVHATIRNLNLYLSRITNEGFYV